MLFSANTAVERGVVTAIMIALFIFPRF